MSKVFDRKMNWEEYFYGKSVAILGNAKIKWNDEKKYDIIIRMNEADYKDNDARTDILAISHMVEMGQVRWVSPDYIMWMTRKRRYLRNQYDVPMFYYPMKWWTELYETLGSRPSTGCMVVDWVSHFQCTWDIFGYSFDQGQIVGSHNIRREREYIKGLK
jgi:hypothetical protein